MRALSERDAAALAAVTAELAVLDDAEPFPTHFLGRLAQLLDTPSAGYSELDRARKVSISAAWWADGDEVSWREGSSEVLADDLGYWRLRRQHPVCSYRERSGDWTSTRNASDFVTLREFRCTEIWNELYRPKGINHWIDVGLEPTGAETHVFIFDRGRVEFDERDRLLLDLLQPHLQRRYDRVRAAADADDAIASLEEQAGDDPRHVVLCSGDGVIEFASPQSRRLLAGYLQCTNGHLPDDVVSALLQRGRPVAFERDGRRLTLRAAPSAGLIVVLVGEEDVRLERLTARQRTILEHAAQGMTDSQIADALGIARATVKKHLEQIYERLGVHTRTAAAAVLARP